MSITFDNYQAYFLDYHEGNLNSEELSELSLFLVLHPELKAELNSYDSILLLPENQSFQNRSRLKKFSFDETPIDDDNFGDFCIASSENILNDEKLKELAIFCENKPSLKKDFNLYQKISLKPNLRVRFKNKRKLYQKSFLKYAEVAIGLRIVAVAAGIALLIGIYIGIEQGQKSTKQTTAVVSLPKVGHTSGDATVAAKVDQVTKKQQIRSEKKADQPLVSAVETPAHVSEQNMIRETSPAADIKFPEFERLRANELMTNLKPVPAETKQLSGNVETDHNLLVATNDIINSVEEKITTTTIFKIDRKKISFFRLAQAGIQGMNKLTDSNMTLTEKIDSTRNITALSFESQLLKYKRSKHF